MIIYIVLAGIFQFVSSNSKLISYFNLKYMPILLGGDIGVVSSRIIFYQNKTGYE